MLIRALQPPWAQPLIYCPSFIHSVDHYLLDIPLALSTVLDTSHLVNKTGAVEETSSQDVSSCTRDASSNCYAEKLSGERGQREMGYLRSWVPRKVVRNRRPSFHHWSRYPGTVSFLISYISEFDRFFILFYFIYLFWAALGLRRCAGFL